LLKHQIPIRTEHWDVTEPGYVEIDLVSHSGNARRQTGGSPLCSTAR
jgi:hypothetical protein